LQDYIEGDLLEVYAKRLKKSGKWIAEIQFVIDVLWLFRPGIIKPMEGSQNLNTYGMYKSYFKMGWRTLLREKLFSFINITGLSIGITCTLVIAIFVRYELSFDRYHEKADSTYKIVQETKFAEETQYWNTTAYPLAEALRNDFSELPFVTQAAGPMPRFFRVEDENGNVSRFEEKLVLFVDAYYPKVFDFKWIEGDPSTALSKPSSIVLTRSLVYKYFNLKMGEGESVLGKHMMLNNKDELTVTGVVEDAPANTTLKYTMLIPYEFFRINNPYFSSNWSGNYQGSTFLVMNNGQSTMQMERQLLDWKKKYLKPEDDNRIVYHLQPLTAMHTDSKFGSSPESYIMPQKLIYASTGIAIFILIVACVNFVNLATAQAANRAKEVGVRKMMGGSRFELVKQFLSEHILLVSITLLVSLELTQLAIYLINQNVSIIDLHLSLDWEAVVMALLIGCIVIILACIYPALVMASGRPIESLKSKFNTLQSGGLSLRRLLIGFQSATVQLFVIGTLVVASQINYFKNKDMGFDSKSPIIITNLNELERTEAFRQKLLSNPAIKDVCFSSSSPLSDYNHHYGTSFRLPNQREEDGKEAEEKGVDLNYISFYKLQLLAGRNFSSLKPTFDEFIVNEKVIKAMGWSPEQAIGQKLVINEGVATIVGVIKDFHNYSLQEEITPCIFLNSSAWLDRSNIKLQPTSNLSETLPFIENAWKELYPEGYYNFTFLDDALARNYAVEQLVFRGFFSFSILTILIGCLGLYGLVSYVTIRKAKEVGIRKVLGASVVSILHLFSQEFIALVLFAFVVAAPLSYYLMDQWLQSFAYRIEISWWILALGAAISMAIALLTIGFQTIKTAMANPIESLRSE
jgi:putative ABC transport system permease protein